MDKVGDLVAELSQVKGCKFIATTYETKGTGEVQDVTLAIGFSIETMYEKDVIELESRIYTDVFVHSDGHHTQMTALERQAAEKILASRRESLDKGIGNNSAYTQGPDSRGGEGTWLHIPGLPGVKIHKETGSLNLAGILVRKDVIVPGVYKTVNSAPLTLARRSIEKTLPSGKFRTYSLENVGTIRLNGETLTIQNL